MNYLIYQNVGGTRILSYSTAGQEAIVRIQYLFKTHGNVLV